MTRILLSGCNGKMGHVITSIIKACDDMEIVAGYSKDGGGAMDYPVYTDINSVDRDADVVIDFSNPASVASIADFVVKRNISAVIATTGLEEEHMRKLQEASKVVPILVSSNMSLGVNLIMNLVKKAATVLQGFDVEIVEKHHNQKLDAPSGTAMFLADAINSARDGKLKYVYDRHNVRERRQNDEIGLHAVRAGTFVGVHEVIFAGADEVVEIKHTAMSRSIFAEGAVKAARFVCKNKPGMYSMQDVIGF